MTILLVFLAVFCLTAVAVLAVLLVGHLRWHLDHERTRR